MIIKKDPRARVIVQITKPWRSVTNKNAALTSTMLCMCGRRRSRRTSSSMTRALHTFFLTSGSSSVARANRFYKGQDDAGVRYQQTITITTA